MAAPEDAHQEGMPLGSIDEAQLRAWVDAGYMSPEEYRAEMERRQAKARAKSSPTPGA